MGKVYIKIPKTGLGNCLLVWAQGIVFARLNQCDYVVSRWSRFRWGALIRFEKKNRFYRQYFRETPFWRLLITKARLAISKKDVDPAIATHDIRNETFVFTQYSAQTNMFRPLVQHEAFVKQELLKLLAPGVSKKLAECQAPVIGVHVRRGDFKVANPITPISFFVDVIQIVRQTIKEDLPVTVFTDANEEEISEILMLPDVSLSSNKEDILDILQMSMSRYLVLSRSSTFSYWAAFLSRGLVIMSEEDWQKRLKPDGSDYRELRYSKKNAHLFTEQLRQCLTQFAV